MMSRQLAQGSDPIGVNSNLWLKQKQEKKKYYYGENSKPLPPWQKGDSAWMQVQGRWEHVMVMHRILSIQLLGGL